MRRQNLPQMGNPHGLHKLPNVEKTCRGGGAMNIKKVDLKDGKWQFDQAMENANWDQEVFDWAIAETIKGLDAAETNEFWKQHNEWKQKCGE
jgi:hypothetical protein